ncbi:MAG: glycosyltransferase family 1 protein [Erysipelotrichia bacterium]|nr:glycosyltransferase family 1 protein [Erysipelotrichia bacterium]
MNEKKKALVVTTVASTIDQFCMNDISILLEDYDVQVAANFMTGNNTSKERVNEFESELINKNIGINIVEFNRNPLSRNNLVAYKSLKKIMVQNKFDLIHCHTPIAAMFARLASKELRSKGSRVIYTAHGFHFYKGAPLLNWILYYPIEKWLSNYTNVLITINKEDYALAQKSFNAGKVEYVPGVGLDIDKINSVKVDKKLKRKEIGVPNDCFLLLSVGELNKNKNHEVVIKALAQINDSNIHYIVCGQGKLEKYLKDLSRKLGVDRQVHLLGYRKDIIEICKASDLFVFPSLREGLGMAALEAMVCGLPIVTSNVHGIVDYSDDRVTGFACSPKNIKQLSTSIVNIKCDSELYNITSRNNPLIVKRYDFKYVMNKLILIYQNHV